eukprot:3336535-Prorocentrum_lima.AAC.1
MHGGAAVENASGGRVYDTLALLQSLRLSRMLRNASKLKAVVDQCITAVFPSWAGIVLQRQW